MRSRRQPPRASSPRHRTAASGASFAHWSGTFAYASRRRGHTHPSLIARTALRARPGLSVAPSHHVRSILAAAGAAPQPRAAGQALVLTLPAVPTRSLNDYAISDMTGNRP
jgi:hypothetical protein